jgi:hypothetical protein
MESSTGWHIGSRAVSSFGLGCSTSAAGLAASPSWAGLGMSDPSNHDESGDLRQSSWKAPSYSGTVLPTYSLSTWGTGVDNGPPRIWSIYPLLCSSWAEAW